MPKRLAPAAGPGLPKVTPLILVEATIHRLVDILDRLQADSDFEPSLGSLDGAKNQTQWSAGGDRDLEFDDSDDEDGGDDEDSGDREPSLGAVDKATVCRSESFDQSDWGHCPAFHGVDLEGDEGELDGGDASDFEDSLGAPVGDGDQRRWCQGAPGDLEAQGTAGDIPMERDPSRLDLAALAETERQVRLLARRLRRRGPAKREGEDFIVADRFGDLHRLTRCD